MSISEIISDRGIEEILHFTTNKGITGILATDYLMCRKRLPQEDYLEHIYQYNCENRSRDRMWWGFINLSISSVNRKLFGISSGNWHYGFDGWWCVLSFKPEICTHENVYFTTTNNMYSGVKRGQGIAGMEAMFAHEIVRWNGNVVSRLGDHEKKQPTCEQAEVLYPDKLSLEYLICVYVENEEIAAKFDSIKSLFDKWGEIPCIVRPEVFANNR